MFVLEDITRCAWTKSHTIPLHSLRNLPAFGSFLSGDICFVSKTGIEDSNLLDPVKVLLHYEDVVWFYDVKSQELRRIGNLSKGRKLSKLCFFHSNSLLLPPKNAYAYKSLDMWPYKLAEMGRFFMADILIFMAFVRQFFNPGFPVIPWRAIMEELVGFGATVHTCSRHETELNQLLHEWSQFGYKVTGSVCGDKLVQYLLERRTTNTVKQSILWFHHPRERLIPVPNCLLSPLGLPLCPVVGLMPLKPVRDDSKIDEEMEEIEKEGVVSIGPLEIAAGGARLQRKQEITPILSRNNRRGISLGQLEIVSAVRSHPNVRLRDEDKELFEMNYVEFIRRDIEGSDLNTRRRIACELLKGVATNYKDQVTAMVGVQIKNVLAAFATNPASKWKEKDCAIYLVVTLARKKAGWSSVSIELIDVGNFFSSVIVHQRSFLVLDPSREESKSFLQYNPLRTVGGSHASISCKKLMKERF
ncbi:hypothetical protein IFM89_039165 [Coptis chinensis]|uniref:Exportin-2 central domain-containing protein n=1 Tax=Coptis chinensis TaxID=261450 RepID=A0A835HQK1_9MAGN|nr:hypothetical protein IFM89_039165 [Coptis chinensis]